MSGIFIKDVKTIVTAPNNINLVIVKVETTEPELVGYGCATFTWRYKAVVSAIEDYLRPQVIGCNVSNIEDLWQTMKGSSYWRNGPVLNNAISGIDEALWDIKGKMANMPVYDLIGGKSREGIPVYRHADGKTAEEVEENIYKFIDEGFHYIRVQMNTYGGNFDGSSNNIWKPENAPEGAYYSPREYMRNTIRLFERVRKDIGWDIELLHDIHERLPLPDTLDFVHELDQFKLFFVEDALPPSQVSYFKLLREHTSSPLAFGELFSNSLEWKSIVANNWIDFIRAHLSDIGGFTPARKLAAFAEAYGVRTAWHGPGDLSPIGMAAQLHLDTVVNNFGIQEFQGFGGAEEDMFEGAPVLRNGYAYVNDKPGWGIVVHDDLAAKYPPVKMDYSWLYPRLQDGTAVRP